MVYLTAPSKRLKRLSLSTMTDRVLERQRQIQQDIACTAAGYTDLWRRITREWRDSITGCHTWLTYAANYLFSFDGFKWALDPFAMSSRVANISAPDYRADLALLSLIVLTHEHNDHLDMALVRALADLDIRWIIPHFLLEKIRRVVNLPMDKVIIPVPGEMIDVGLLQLVPFESLHMRGGRGVPETGYLVRFAGRRWLFPGDIRNYDFKALPSFGRLDGVFAHLWLGKAQALADKPPLLEDFCAFFTSFKTERLIIGHMNEFGRDENDLWRESHFEVVREAIAQRKPGLRVEKALMGDRIDMN